MRDSKGRFIPKGSDEYKETIISILVGDIMNDMDTIAECSHIRALIYEALQKLDKVQAKAVERNEKREKQIRDIRSFNNCVISNYFEQNIRREDE